jgi:hypothetical protein
VFHQATVADDDGGDVKKRPMRQSPLMRRKREAAGAAVVDVVRSNWSKTPAKTSAPAGDVAAAFANLSISDTLVTASTSSLSASAKTFTPAGAFATAAAPMTPARPVKTDALTSPKTTMKMDDFMKTFCPTPLKEVKKTS